MKITNMCSTLIELLEREIKALNEKEIKNKFDTICLTMASIVNY